MSRIGKQPVSIPEGVTVTLEGSRVAMKGPQGELIQNLHPHVAVRQHANELHVSVEKPALKTDRALWGLSRVLLSNMVEGVTRGFTKSLEIHGVGYRIQVSGKTVTLSLGFSHPVVFQLPEGITAKMEENVLTIQGIEKQLVGEIAARIRGLKKPEPYKGKGIRYVGEVVRRKAGKVMKTTE
jgi:large subunit ribosomal protein L6